jgi:DNA-binding NtrC family response regulator
LHLRHGADRLRRRQRAVRRAGARAPEPAQQPETLQPDAPQSISLDDRLREVETNLIGWALKVSDGNKSKAAALLHIKRSTLGDRIARCGMAESEAMEEDANLAVAVPA